MKPLHLAIGIFDGVHRGHRYLIHSAIQVAKANNGLSGALTFHPHPKKVLGLPNAPQLIYPIQQRYWLLKKFGCDYVFIKKFTEPWSQSSPDRFFSYLKRLFPNLAGLYVGEDFHFGHQRSGDVYTLQDLCKSDGNIKLNVFKHLHYTHERICSTRIRNCLQQGNISEANNMLGINYHYIGYISNFKHFIHHNELPIKDGIYFGTLKNKHGDANVKVSVTQGQLQLINSLDSIFQHKACLLEITQPSLS